MGLKKIMLYDSAEFRKADKFIFCEKMAKDVIVSKGKKGNGKILTNPANYDNGLFHGDLIKIGDAQCILITVDFKPYDLCAEPGDFTYDSETEPLVFYEDLDGVSITKSMQQYGKEFVVNNYTNKPKTYYFNTSEMDIKFKNSSPIPFDVKEKQSGINMLIDVTCEGVCRFKVTDPILFYTNLCGEINKDYKCTDFDHFLQPSIMAAIISSFDEMQKEGILYEQLLAHKDRIGEKVVSQIQDKFKNRFGVSILHFDLQHIYSKDEARINSLRARAPHTPIKNKKNVDIDMWTCKCGVKSSGKFCPECGGKRIEVVKWTCKCGTINKGKFCTECGSPKEA